jgi:N-acetylglucosaminyl-diphospho-decaprenol L-rhamnosyltransferase
LDAVTVTSNNGAQLQKLIACKPLMSAFDRVLVVDNVSSDGSPEIAARGGAMVITRTEPGGYGSCVNMGARETAGPVFAVLNPDVTFDDSDVVEHLSRRLEDSGIGLVAPALVLPDGRIQDSARHIPTPLDLLLRRHFDAERGAIWDGGEVAWVVGACFIVRRDAWNTVGGFDERFFLYFDDVDLCWRLRQAGWSTYLEPSVKVRHEFGAQSRRPLWTWQTRRHLVSAARFYRENPRFLITRSLPPRTRTAIR